MKPSSILFVTALLLYHASGFSFIFRTGYVVRTSRLERRLSLGDNDNALSAEAASVPETILNAPSNLESRLGLEERFDRWRFLQKVLDQEVPWNDTNEILLSVLHQSLLRQQQQQQSSSAVEGSQGVSGLVHLTQAQQQRIQAFLEQQQQQQLDTAPQEGVILLSDLLNHPEVLDELETLLLPDPDEDPDAFQGLWDTVIELHGRAAVQVEQQRPNNYEWKTFCLATRILLHYDFLSLGMSR